MDLHANAVLTVRQRQRLADLVAAGVTITAAALVVGCSRQTASKWVNRRRRDGAGPLERLFRRTDHGAAIPARVTLAPLGLTVVRDNVQVLLDTLARPLPSR